MLVSIITPTFNREKFLAEAIDSVLNQTIADFELIIVDDGSTDNSKALIEPYIEKDSRVRYFYQKNQGQSVARNLALTHATGEYICFLDSDNYWPHDKLEKSLKAFEQYPQADIVYGDCITINEAGDITSYQNMRRHSGRITKHLLRDNCVSMNTTMTRRKCFDEMGGMSCSRRVADDYDLWLKFSAKYYFKYIPDYLVFYRVMENQISSNKDLRFSVNEQIVLDFLKLYPESVTLREKNNGFAETNIRRARYLASIGLKKEAFSFVFKAFKYAPFSVDVLRSWVKVVIS